MKQKNVIHLLLIDNTELCSFLIKEMSEKRASNILEFIRFFWCHAVLLTIIKAILCDRLRSFRIHRKCLGLS